MNSAYAATLTSLSSLKKIHNPRYVGPGVWITIHLIAKHIDEVAIKHGKNLITYMLMLIEHIKEHFPCMECRKHFDEMMKTHNIIDVKLGDVFNYTYRIHNIVNDRIHRKKPSHDTVTRWYTTLKSDPDDILEINPPFIKDKMGPGIWWLLHSTSIKNTDLYTFTMDILLHMFPCDTCREELNNYVSNDSFIHYPKDKYPFYTWQLHEHVNTKLNKPNIPFDDVDKFYKTDTGCNEDCTNVPIHGKSFRILPS